MSTLTVPQSQASASESIIEPRPLSTVRERPASSGERGVSPPEPKGARHMTKTAEARKTIDEALGRLSEELASGKSDSLQAFLSAVGRFHTYSFGNVMLILSQKPNAVRVAGYRTWQSLGRQVRKGEKGITIIAPMSKKKESPNADDTETTLWFRAISVFDISQTDGDDLPQLDCVSGDPGEYYTRLYEYAASLGIPVRYASLSGALGRSFGGSIALDFDLYLPDRAAQRFEVLAHELAHELMHHGEGAVRGDKATRELEAEAVAYVVCNAIGLETGNACSDYIQWLGGDAELLAKVLDRVQKTSAGILDAVLNASAATTQPAT